MEVQLVGQPNVGQPGVDRRAIARDLIVAIALAAILSLGWATTEWHRLSRLLLPDPDDMMRLAQVRDWIAGQDVNDWTQYRMAPPHGAPMHWSRVNDAGIAALILGATPVVGRYHAELFAVLAYPGLLFVCALYLSIPIGRMLWGSSGGPIAAILTALAYPGTTVFIPGRIDHHALQVVLIQVIVLMLMRAPTARNGAVAGVCAGLSLIVGLETAPQVVALVTVLFALWVVKGRAERARLAGFAVALAATTGVALLFLRPTYWSAALCDAFTPASSTATMLAAGALAALAWATPRLATWRRRVGVGAMLGAAAGAATILLYPSCLIGPYGRMDPFLLVAFIPHIDEANSIFAQHNLARAISIAGMLVAGCVASAWMIARERQRWATMLPIVAVVATSALVMTAQVRGAYIGAPLSTPILAGLVVVARRRTTWRVPALVGAWLAGAGAAYHQLPRTIEQLAGPLASPVPTTTAQMICNSGDAWQQVAKLPPGVTMAPTTMASYLIGATQMSTVGAGYHRNNDGNMAMYRFFLSVPERSLTIGRAWGTRYVAFCPGDFEEIDVTRNFPNSLAARLAAGQVPPWLQPVPLRDADLRFYRIASR